MKYLKISDKAVLLIGIYGGAVKVTQAAWAAYNKSGGPSMSVTEEAERKERKARSELRVYIARLEQKVEQLESGNAPLKERPDWCPLQELGEDQMTDFYRLLYAWEDARDEYMKCLGGITFDQDDVKVKADAAAKAKVDLVEWVKGLGR